MDEILFEYMLRTDDLTQILVKAKKFCREVYGTDNAEFVAEFLYRTAESASLFGGYRRYSKILAFQAEILRDLDAAGLKFECETEKKK